MNTFTTATVECICSHYSGQYSIKQDSKKAAFVPDAECWQETPAQHMGSSEGTHHSRSPITSTNDWFHSPKMTLIRDVHHSYTASYDPPSANIRSWHLKFREGTVTAAPPLLSDPLKAPSAVQGGSDPQSAPQRGSPASVCHGDVAETGHLRTEGMGVLPSPMSCYCENQRGPGIPFCILLYFLLNLRSSLAIHLLLHCLHNSHFY